MTPIKKAFNLLYEVYHFNYVFKMSCHQCNEYKECIRTYLQNARELAILLDYDGTLTPTAASPDLSIMPQSTKDLLERLSKIPQLFIAIISGRAVKILKELIGLENLVYSGNHGLEVIYPDGTTYLKELPEGYDTKFKEMMHQLETEVAKDGAWIENKDISLTFHLRPVPEPVKTELAQKTKEVVPTSDFKLVQCHSGYEVGPKIDWNKGNVALLILDKKYENNWKGKVKVIYIGDDTSDEEAMKALKGYSMTFRIIKSPDVETVADVKIMSSKSVVEILLMIEEYFRSR